MRARWIGGLFLHIILLEHKYSVSCEILLFITRKAHQFSLNYYSIKQLSNSLLQVIPLMKIRGLHRSLREKGVKGSIN